MWKSTISEKVLIRFLNCFNIFALCEQFWKIWILGPLLRQKGSPCCQNLGPLKKSCKSVYVARCKVEFRVLILSLECFRSYVKRTIEGVLTSRHFQIFLFQSPTHLNPQQPATLGTLRVKVRLHFQIFLFQSPTQLNPLWGPVIWTSSWISPFFDRFFVSNIKWKLGTKTLHSQFFLKKLIFDRVMAI